MSLPVWYTYYDATNKPVHSDRNTGRYEMLDLTEDALKREALTAIFKLSTQAENNPRFANRVDKVTSVGINRAGYKPTLVSLADVAAYAATPEAEVGYLSPQKFDAKKRAVVAAVFPAFK